MKQWLAVVMLILVMDWVSASHPDIEYSNIWETEISGGEETAKRVAKELGYTYHGKLKAFDDRYVVTKDSIPEQASYKSDHVTKELQNLDEVKWARQYIVPKALADPEAGSYLRKLCSVVDPPAGHGSSSNTAPAAAAAPAAASAPARAPAPAPAPRADTSSDTSSDNTPPPKSRFSFLFRRPFKTEDDTSSNTNSFSKPSEDSSYGSSNTGTSSSSSTNSFYKPTDFSSAFSNYKPSDFGATGLGDSKPNQYNSYGSGSYGSNTASISNPPYRSPSFNTDTDDLSSKLEAINKAGSISSAELAKLARSQVTSSSRLTRTSPNASPYSSYGYQYNNK